MKRFGQIEIITAVIMIVTSLASPAGAGILWSGDVDPSDPSTWNSSTTGYIGKFSNGTVGITSGSDVIDYRGYIGDGPGSTGEVTVDGAGSTWTNSSYLNVGRSGSGTLNITDGGAVSNSYGYIGFGSGGAGEVTVDGAGSTWTNSDKLLVGYQGNGTLNITGGGTVSNNSYGHIGYEAGSTGEVTVDGANSSWTNSIALTVGFEGNGTLNITGGSAVSSYGGFIGYDSGVTGAVTVDGTGSTWTSNGELRVGGNGDGTLNITDGGAVSNTDGIIGYEAGSTGEVTVDGAGSTWTNSDDLYVGDSGDGTLNITGGGLVSVAGGLTIDQNGGNDSFINMATGGMLALFGDGGDSLIDFMGLIAGTDAIRYWNDSIAGWADITGATLGIDYTLEYLTEGDLADYTMLTVPEPVIPINLDINPGSCPNPVRVNFKGNGVIPVAILGTEDFDVLDIDVATIALEGVSPFRSGFEDVSAPSDGEECDCNSERPDGYLDLTVKFKRKDVLAALEESLGDLSEIEHRTDIPLALTVMLMDEEETLEGTDCVRILNRRRRR